MDLDMCDDDNLNNENLHLMLSLGTFVPSEEVSCQAKPQRFPFH